MNFEGNTGKTIQLAFDEYHSTNPLVYDEFKKLAFTAIDSGKSKISFKLMLNVVRWESYLKTSETTDVTLNSESVKFKINDAYSSRYARLFITEFPQHSPKIELRQLRA